MKGWPRDLYTGPDGGLYKGPCDNHFSYVWPPIYVLIKELEKRGMNKYADILKSHTDYSKFFCYNLLKC